DGNSRARSRVAHSIIPRTNGKRWTLLTSGENAFPTSSPALNGSSCDWARTALMEESAKWFSPFSGGYTTSDSHCQEKTMKLYRRHEINNRDSKQVYGDLEARIEALKQRSQEL